MTNQSLEIPLLRTRLSVQMFLQYAIWGIWLPVLGNHLSSIGIDPVGIGMVYGTGPLALMIAPLIAGQIADRYFSTERYLSVSFFLSGVLFYLIADAKDLNTIFGLSLASMIFFGPTLGLANSLCFHHLKSGEKDFPLVRVWGTLGWIAAGWILYAWMKMDEAHHPVGHCFYIASILSVVNGFYVLTLPHTPPKGDSKDKFPLGQVVGMLKDPSFLVFILLAFMVLIFATFYYNSAGLFLEKGVGIEQKNISRVMGIGQVMEILTMFLLSFSLRKLGTKATIAIGIIAWGLRFGIFAIGSPKELVVAAQALHGVCFAFAIAAAMIYVDKISAADIKGSMQSFLAFVTYGVGMFLGSLLAAKVMDIYTTPGAKFMKFKITPDVTSWSGYWMVPTVGCAVALILFLAVFRAKETRAEEHLSAGQPAVL